MKVRRTTTRRGARRLFLESLESRRVLDGGALPLLGLSSSPAGEDDPAGTADLVNPPLTGTLETGAIGRFGSAQELTDFLIADAKERYAGMFGQPAWSQWLWLDESGAVMALASMAANDAAVRGDYSTTNVQVAGVDEADILKTDGRYLYISSDQGVTIVDTAGPAGLAVASRLELDSQPVAMYLSDGRLAVVTTEWHYDVMPMVATALGRCPTSAEPELSLDVYDVSSPAEPHLVSEFQVEGHYVDSRLIGDTILLVTRSDFYLPPPERVPVAGTDDGDRLDGVSVTWQTAEFRVGLPWIEPPITKYVYETAEQYFARIGDRVLELALANYSVGGADGAETAAGFWTTPEQIYRPLDATHDSLVSLAAIELSGPEPGVVAATGAPIDWTSQLYVSLDNVYVVSPQWGADGGASSAINKFAVDLPAKNIDLAATGQVPGTLLNQFSLDEHGGQLRVVTQEGWRNTAESNLYVLAEDGDQLVVVGRLENLTPGEQLYSVRFQDDQAFVVTFGPDSGVWYDPLLTIDLSDPTQPQLQGQLEIPGFANYLQVIGDDYLIGLGRNADESNGRPLEPQVSLYDVADVVQPELADRLSFGDATSWSPAFANHHAINYFPEYGVLAIPMTTMLPMIDPVEPSPDLTLVGNDSPLPWYQSALWVFHVEADPADRKASQLTLLGTIAHADEVVRSVRIEDRLYSVSRDWIQVHPILDPATGLGQLFLGEAAQPDWFAVEADSRDNPLDVLANDQLPASTADGAVIAGVSESSAGGAVTIAADRRSLRYTPPADFRGADYFTYTVDDGAGGTSEGQVTVCVQATKEGQRMAELARTALAEKLSVPADQIAVVSIEEVDWPDTSLGVPEPGMSYLTVIVPGFRVVLQYDATEYQYHTDSQDRVVLAGTRPITPVDPVTGDEQPAEPLVQIRLEVVDEAGDPLEVVEVGDRFQVQVYVQDLRDDPQGVAAAYLDILFRNRLVSLNGAITFDADYSAATGGDATSPGLLDEVGAAADGAVLDGAERLLATIPFRADRPGVVRFVMTPADDDGHAVSLVGDDAAVPESRVRLAGTEVVIAGWQNVEDPCDVNDDGRSTPMDALDVINDINLHGVRWLGRLANLVAGVGAAVTTFPDVNGDGCLSARDVLVVINRLNGAVEPAVADQPTPSLATLVDWGAVQDALQNGVWAEPLQALELTTDEVLDLAHEALTAVDMDWLHRQVSDGGAWRQFRRDLGRGTGEQAVALLTQIGQRLENVDELAAVKAAAAEREGMSADEANRQALSDRLFAELGDAPAWLTRFSG